MGPLEPISLVILLVPGLALLIVLRIFYRRQVVTSSIVRMSLSITAWLLIAMAIVGMGVSSLLYLSLFYLPLLIIGMLMVLDRYRRGEHHTLLHTLAFSAEKGVPLPEAARAYAQEHAGDTGARATALAERLEAGATLSAAISYARLRLSTAMRLAANLSDILAARGLALRAPLHWGNEADAALRAILNRLLYLVWIWIALVSIGAFLMIEIVPIFRRIFEDWDIPLPMVTEVLFSCSRNLVNGGWTLLIPGLLVSSVILCAGMFFYTGWYDLPLFRNLRKQGVAGLCDTDAFRVVDLAFVFRMFVWRYDASLVMRSLALLMRQNTPLPQALMVLANVYPRGNVRRRLTAAALDIQQGGDWKQAFRRQWFLGNGEQALLASAERAGNLPWALDELADSLMRRMAYRLTVIHQIVFPVLLLLSAVCVSYFCVALILPLVQLVWALS
jgi:type II secretory pathway component PulF